MPLWRTRSSIAAVYRRCIVLPEASSLIRNRSLPARALEAGAKELNPVAEHRFADAGPRPVRRASQGRAARSHRAHVAGRKIS